MARDRRAYLWDVVQAADDIYSFILGKSEQDYAKEAMLRAAIERKLEIIGEALSQAAKYFPQVTGQISRCEQVIALRNRLIHGYSTISDSLVWDIVRNDVPVLRQEAHKLLNEPGA